MCFCIVLFIKDGKSDTKGKEKAQNVKGAIGIKVTHKCNDHNLTLEHLSDYFFSLLKGSLNKEMAGQELAHMLRILGHPIHIPTLDDTPKSKTINHYHGFKGILRIRWH